MYFFYEPVLEAARLLTNEKTSRKEELALVSILEDTNSPITNKYLEQLFNSVISKKHVDFDTIPQSKGNIVEYKGYTNMIEVLENILKLAADNNSESVVEYVNIVKTAIRNMIRLAPLYQKGFSTGSDYVQLEYNTLVYTIVQATSTLLYEFVDYVKRPNMDTIQISIKNNKYKANMFYFEQLNKFNLLNTKMNYADYIKAMVLNGKNNFTGIEALGLATVVGVALAVIPILREIVFRMYVGRAKLSECLAQQAYFLELNKSVIEANSDFNRKKKDQILIRQEKIRNLCLRLSEKLRVDHIKSIDAGKAELKADNKLLTLDTVKKEVDDSPLQLL